MARYSWRLGACWTIVLALMIGLLGACSTAHEGGAITGTTAPPNQQVVSYSSGQYRLYGAGTTAAPYYWVWVPVGTTAPPPPGDTSNSTVQYDGGRYQLRGNGTTASPYYWVWIPTGAQWAVNSSIPPPPSLPVNALPVNAASVAQPGGQYQLYGSGTAASPYYWVWVPSGGSAIPPPPPPPR